MKLVLVFLTFFISFGLFAEGTKQVWPSGLAGEKIGLQIWDFADPARQFATYDGSPDYRLNVRISHTSEVIYFGFKEDASTSGLGNMYFRIYDPTGTLVYGPALVPTSGTGFINNWGEANTGPASLNPGGYADLSYNPTLLGDYYIEFNGQNPNTKFIEKRRLEFFDVTVANGTTVKPGRLWSKNWDFSAFTFSNRAFSKLFVYSNDGVVSQLDLNGIQPFGFEVQTNGVGPIDTGNPLTDRQSSTGKLGFPDYKIFLNDPDILEFPTGVFAGLGSNPAYMEGCSGTYCINVDYTSSGYAEILLDFNGNGINDGTDVLLTKNVVSGYNCYPWDGKDNVGTTITHGVSVNVESTILAGMTHYPVYDAENHTNGFIVNIVRPTGLPTPVLFYDDSPVGGGTNLAGCVAPCHTWTGNFGNILTLNTWWFGLSIQNQITLVNNQCSPEAINDTITGEENQPLVIDVLNIGVDFDSDGDDIFPTSVGTDASNGTTYAGGTVTINDNGTPADLTDDYVDYIPVTDFSGLDSAYYILYDEMGGFDTALIYIYINGDFDGDGIVEPFDIDSDNDGIPDALEDGGTGFDPSKDADGDGIPNHIDDNDATPGFPVFTDVNGDGIADVYDRDLDGNPDYLDLDADNDGIPDVVEAGGQDTDGDGFVDDPTDSDSDGLLDQYDASTGGDNISLPDSDGDGIYDYLDVDSDNDGLTDTQEAGGLDADGDGRADNYTDVDGDGFNDSVDGDVGNDGTAENSANALQLTGLDTDADGIPNSYPEGDFDGDGLLDQIDIDTDNDGIVDNVEAQAEGGYVIPSGTDTDGDGLDDAYDTDNGGTPLSPVDTDGDGTTDHKDLDSDNDTVPDLIEGHDANSDGIADTTPSGTDTDGDGLDDAFDTSAVGPGNSTGSNSPLQDFDTDLLRDWRDTDDDNDGIATQDETGDVDASGQPDYLEVALCPPGQVAQTTSGNADAVIASNLMTNPTNALGATTGDFAIFAGNNASFITLDLTDIVPSGTGVLVTWGSSDGANAKIDVDYSLDNVSYFNITNLATTSTSVTNNVTLPADARYLRFTRDKKDPQLDLVAYSSTVCLNDNDQDGIPDNIDLDDDNDGISDLVEGDMLLDTDGDGIPNSLDLDSDNDGIPDAVEANGGTLPANMNTEGQYSAAFIADVTNDVNVNGWYETSEGGTTYANNVVLQIDTDNDGFNDFIDLDADNDCIPDAIEANDGVLPANMDDNGQYPAVYAAANDADGDGIMDDIDPDNANQLLPNNDYDNDGEPNYLDLDADGDGIPDAIEGSDPDPVATGSDGDNDGIDDACDSDNGGTPANLPDTDCNGIIDYLDASLASVASGNFPLPSIWTNGIAPSTNGSIQIIGTTTIDLTGDVTIGSLSILTGGTLNLNGFALTIVGNVIVDGTLNTQGGEVIFAGSCAQTFCGDVAFDFLTVNNSNGLTIDCGCVQITEVLDLETGVLDVCSATCFTLASSNATDLTASIDPTGTGTITCDVEVERYKEGCADGFLSLATPFATNTPADWGDDLLITGLTGGPFPTFWESLNFYNESAAGAFDDGWTVPGHYTSSTLQRGLGYYMYAGLADLPAKIIVSGAVDLTPFAFPLDFTNTGVQLEDGYNLLGNPYPSAIDWNGPGWTKVDCCDATWVWNECNDQFASLVGETGTNGASSIIEAEQAFWVKAHTSSAALTVSKESMTTGNGDYRSSINETAEVKFHVNGFSNEDEIIIRWNNLASHGHDDFGDAVNMISNQTLMGMYSIDDAGMDVSINSFPDDGESKVIPFMVRVPANGLYTMDMSTRGTIPENACLVLLDKVTNDRIPVVDGMTFSFNATSTSMFINRFELEVEYKNFVSSTKYVCEDATAAIDFDASTGVGPYNVSLLDANNDVVSTLSNQLANHTFSGLAIGSYSLNVEDLGSTECSNFTNNIEVINGGMNQIAESVLQPSCNGTTEGSIQLVLDGDESDYTILWSSGQTTASLENLVPGVYTAAIQDSLGCTTNLTYEIDEVPVNPLAQFELSTYEIDLSLENEITTHNLSSDAINYHWNFGNGTSATSLNSTMNFDSVGLYTVTLTAYGKECSDVVTMDVLVTKSAINENGESDGIPSITLVNEGVMIRFNNNAEDVNVKVLGANGQLVYEEVLPEGQTELFVDLSTRSAQVHTVQLIGNSIKYSKKIQPITK